MTSCLQPAADPEMERADRLQDLRARGLRRIRARFGRGAIGCLDPEDIVGEAMLVFLQKSEGEIGEDAEVLFLHICEGRAIDALRRRSRRGTSLSTVTDASGVESDLLDRLTDERAAPDELVVDREQRGLRLQSVARLSDPDRAVMSLHYRLGLSWEAIAVLGDGRSPDAFRKACRRARRRLTGGAGDE